MIGKNQGFRHRHALCTDIEFKSLIGNWDGAEMTAYGASSLHAARIHQYDRSSVAEETQDVVTYCKKHRFGYWGPVRRRVLDDVYLSAGVALAKPILQRLSARKNE
jgi:hypothetical protein